MKDVLRGKGQVEVILTSVQLKGEELTTLRSSTDAKLVRESERNDSKLALLTC
jgi:hypothetical protein